MFNSQNTATLVVIAPAVITAAATASGYIDTLGFDEASFDVVLDKQTLTTSKPSSLKLAESDTTSGWADITQFVGDGVGGFVIPAVSSSVATVVRLNVDLRGRKRYIQVTVVPTVQNEAISVTATLGKAEDTTIARALMSKVVDG